MVDEFEKDLLWNRFHEVVTMTSEQLRAWLLTQASSDSGFPPCPDLNIEELGRGVLHVLSKRKTDLTSHDLQVMQDVVAFVEDRLADPPPAGAADDDWRHALMSVGHDPLRPGP